MNKIFSSLALLLIVYSVPVISADLPFVSGGISEEGRAELNEVSRNHNLKLVFALNSGAYLSDIKVVIQDSRGGTVVDAVSSGPWFLVQLLPGKYSVTASNKDQSVRKIARVKGSGQTKLNFYWSAE